MKYLLPLIMLMPSIAFANNITYGASITILNENSTVSPGGVLAFKIVGSTSHPSGAGGNMSFHYEASAGVAKFAEEYSYYYYTEAMGHPRYMKAFIESDIKSLPRTEKIIVKLYNKEIASATFYIKEGSHTYARAGEKGKWSLDITAGDAIKGHWYEIVCISSKTGHCNIDIKNGAIDRYNGRVVGVAIHRCSDRGYPGGSRLDVGSPLIFDISKMIQRNTDSNFSPPFGTVAKDVAVCLFTSNAPIMIRPINERHIAFKNK